jgi:UDP-2,4-diacetamido-2,4,6-trideoxy-beta-L-altropyranose hydrolase
MTTDRPLILRCDANLSIGTGHVMRCLALAEAWQDAGGRAAFVMAQSTPAIEERLRCEGVGLVRIEGVPGSDVDGEQLIALTRTHDPAWVAVDGYEFGAGYQRSLKDERLKLILIDDNGRPGIFAADIVLNQNIHARECFYKDRETYTRLLLGTKYTLLRREFVQACGSREISSTARKVLVSMGGSDPANVTCRVMEAMEQVGVQDLEVAVVAGGSNPHLASITESVVKSSHRCRLLNDVRNIHTLISWADLAISAAGSGCWEYCALGLPAVLVAVAENQIPNAQALHAAGAARLVPGDSRFALGEMAELITRLANSLSERQALSRTACTLVDGRGAGRVVSILWGESTS